MEFRHGTLQVYYPTHVRETAAILADALSSYGGVSEMNQVLDLSALAVGERVEVVSTDDNKVAIDFYRRIA